MANLKVKESPRTHAALRTHDVIIDKNDNVGPYLMTIDEFLDDFGVNAVNYRVTEFVSGGAQNASSSFDVYIFRSGGTLQLPDATTLNGQPVIVVNLTSTDTVTVNAFSGQSINGLSSIIITNQDSEQLIPTTTGFVLTAKNKIKSRSETLSWFNANPSVILDKGEQVFLLGSPQYKVGDSISPLNTLPWSNKQLTDYISSNDIALANKQDKLNGGTGLVYSTAGVITYVTLNSGNMSGTITAGKVPISIGGGNFVDGPFYKTLGETVVVSPISTSSLHLNDTTGVASLESDVDITIRAVTGKINLIAPDISNDRVVYVDAYGNIKTGTITPALLANLAGSTSPLQAQIATLDGSVVHLAGAENITAVKTFTVSPIVPSPTTALQAANKAYVDLQVGGNQLKVDAHAVSTLIGGNVTLSGSQTVDTVSSGTGKRFLLPFQTNPAENGLWITAAGAWTRAADLDASIEFNNATIQCRAGSANLNTQWTCTSFNPAVGTDPIYFQQTNLTTTYNNGAGLTLASNTFSISNGAITNAMLAGSIDLTTKVINALGQINGGKGNATVYNEGSIPVQNNASALVEYAELKFDSVQKTLVLNNTKITPSAGLSGMAIQSNSQDSPGIFFNGSGNVIQALYSGADYAITLNGSNASGRGIQVSTIDMAADFSSEKEVLSINQTGEATANMVDPVLTISRDVVLLNANGPIVGGVRQPFTCLGPMINVVDNTPSTSHRILISQQDINQMILTKDGYLGLGNVGAAGFLVDDMVVLEGSTDRTIKVAYHPTSGNAGKKLRLMGGSTAVGSTNLQGGNVEVVTGSSRGNLGANFIIYATAPGSSGSGENSATLQYIFKGDGRVGFGINLPSARFELWTPNGANAFDIINKDQSGTYNTGWGKTPLTNGAGTNLVHYEMVGGVQIVREVDHLGGNKTIGNDSGSGDAKLNVKGTLKVEGGNPGTGKVMYSNSVGLTNWDYLPVTALPSLTYDVTTAIVPSKNIFAGTIPANTFLNDRDKVIYEFIIGNTGGSTATVNYGIRINGNATLFSDIALPLNTTSDPIALKITLERVGSNRIYVTAHYDFGSHSTTLRNIYYAADTTNAYTFSSSISLAIIGDEVATNRHIVGWFGNGSYYKAI